MKKVTRDTPSLDLLNLVKSQFVLNQTSLNAKAAEMGIAYSHARQALMGVWNGKKGQAVRGELCDMAGVK